MSEQSSERPYYKRELLEEAKRTSGSVTETDVNDSGTVARVHAIEEKGGVAYRAMIKYNSRSTDGPRVTFASSTWDSDVGVLAGWSKLAVGRLSGPQTLEPWERIFAVFRAALEEYERNGADALESAGESTQP